MRRILDWKITVIIILSCMLGYSFWSPREGDAAAAKPVKWVETSMGSIPKSWGDVVGVSTIRQQSVVLIFKDGNGKLRRVHWNPTGVLKNVAVLDRTY